jgi:uncharacterized protein YggE
MPEPVAFPTSDERTITVVGAGPASAALDTALLQLGVETRGVTPGEALEACSRALEEVIAAVRAAGVEPPRLATGELSVHPDWEVGPQGQHRPVGYRAAARLTARLDTPARAGQVATAAVTTGGEAARVHGLMLIVGDQAGVLAAAREAAWRDARARAEQYAALVGVALGRVLRIEEMGDAWHAQPVTMGMALAPEAAAAPAVEVGEAEVRARVAVTWALLDAPQTGASRRL